MGWMELGMDAWEQRWILIDCLTCTSNPACDLGSGWTQTIGLRFCYTSSRKIDEQLLTTVYASATEGYILSNILIVTIWWAAGVLKSSNGEDPFGFTVYSCVRDNCAADASWDCNGLGIQFAFNCEDFRAAGVLKSSNGVDLNGFTVFNLARA